MKKGPYLFDEFFASGLEESVSPFLTPSSRTWGKNLPLKNAMLAAFFLVLAFSFSFSSKPLSFFFLSFVYFLSGVPALLASLRDLRNLEINIDVLMTTAAFVAVLIDSGIEGALLLVLFELSHGIEDTVSTKAKSALNNLNRLSPKFATVIEKDGTHFEKSVREIEVGTRVLVKNGEVIPLDGTIVEGETSLNLVHLTGESNPVFKAKEELVPAGAKVLEGAIEILVKKTNAESTLSRIIRLIQEAQEAKPKLQRWLDQFGKRYATTIIILTFVFALTLPLLFSMEYKGHEGSIYRALAFLIAASPCALIIATPTAYLSAISSSAKKGVLLKGGVTLDALSNCKKIAFDKTGTLTLGELVCKEIVSLEKGSISEEKALSIAYGLERQVVHPIASAVCKLAQERNISPEKISSFKATPGFGLEGETSSQPVFMGLAEHFLEKLELEAQKKVKELVLEKKAKGEMIALLAISKEIFLFIFSDEIRKDMPLLMKRLRENLKMTPIMLTGDHEASAKRVANALGIDELFYDLRPEDKLKKVADLSKQGDLAMVGDGINDAPALARANVGISMGKVGSATAVEASDVVLLNDDIASLEWLFLKARKTMRIVKQNITLALFVILFATTPALLGLVPLWLAVVLHEGGTVLVGLNSLRLLKK